MTLSITSTVKLGRVSIDRRRTCKQLADSMVARSLRAEQTDYATYSDVLEAYLLKLADHAEELVSISGMNYRFFEGSDKIGRSWRVVLWMPLEPQAARYR